MTHVGRQGAALGLVFGAWALAAALAQAPAAGPDDRVRLTLDTSEADQVLAIVDRAGTGAAIDSATWNRLFATAPYRRLQRRETQMHREFSDSAFRAFVRSPALARRADSLERTLEAWKRADLAASARRVLAYLPDSARIRASVYPVIKPVGNSFVFEASTDAGIFLSIDPRESAAEFENTVAHEMHHIGFASVPSVTPEARGADSTRVATAFEWMGAFGEGFAMLAAAGGPDVHPHATSPADVRARWDHDMTLVDRDLPRLEAFFWGILDGRLATEDAIRDSGFTFFGIQGPWYTVGYRMAVTIERRYGRPALIACMRDPRLLLARYDAAITVANRRDHTRHAVWSAGLLRRIGA